MSAQRRRFPRAIVFLMLPLAACFHGTVQTARTAGEGKLQAGISGGGGLGVAVFDVAPIPIPDATVSVRYGLRDDLDVGANLGLCSGLGLSIKKQLTPRDAPGRVRSVASSVSFFGMPGLGYWSYAELSLLSDLPRAGGNSLTVSPKLLLMMMGGGTGEEFSIPQQPFPVPGLGFGLAYTRWLREDLALMPDFSIVAYFPGFISVKVGVTFIGA